MRWKRILAGVDESPQAAAALALAVRLARATGGACTPVHAVREWWVAFGDDDLAEHAAELRAAAVDAQRATMSRALAGHVPDEVIRGMIVRPGRPAVVLRDVARELEADMVVLGGKHRPPRDPRRPGCDGTARRPPARPSPAPARRRSGRRR